MEPSSCTEELNRIADYHDYVFYARVLTGISRKQEMTHNVSLRYVNQTLMDHIIRTRQGSLPTYDGNGDSLSSMLSDDEEDELMFELEL